MTNSDRRNRLPAAFVVLALAVLLLASESAGAQGVVLPLPAEDQQTINAQLGSGVVGKALPSTPIAEVSVYFPLQERASVYQVTAGPNAGKVQTLGVQRSDAPTERRRGDSSS